MQIFEYKRPPQLNDGVKNTVENVVDDTASQVSSEASTLEGRVNFFLRSYTYTGGLKSSRRPDILVEKPGGSIYGINVGKTTSSGFPIKREIESIYDLEDAGIPMHFVSYFK